MPVGNSFVASMQYNGDKTGRLKMRYWKIDDKKCRTGKCETEI